MDDEADEPPHRLHAAGVVGSRTGPASSASGDGGRPAVRVAPAAAAGGMTPSAAIVAPAGPTAGGFDRGRAAAGDAAGRRGRDCRRAAGVGGSPRRAVSRTRPKSVRRAAAGSSRLTMARASCGLVEVADDPRPLDEADLAVLLGHHDHDRVGLLGDPEGGPMARPEALAVEGRLRERQQRAGGQDRGRRGR